MLRKNRRCILGVHGGVTVDSSSGTLPRSPWRDWQVAQWDAGSWCLQDAVVDGCKKLVPHIGNFLWTSRTHRRVAQQQQSSVQVCTIQIPATVFKWSSLGQVSGVPSFWKWIVSLQDSHGSLVSALKWNFHADGPGSCECILHPWQVLSPNEPTWSGFKMAS